MEKDDKIKPKLKIKKGKITTKFILVEDETENDNENNEKPSDILKKPETKIETTKTKTKTKTKVEKEGKKPKTNINIDNILETTLSAAVDAVDKSASIIEPIILNPLSIIEKKAKK